MSEERLRKVIAYLLEKGSVTEEILNERFPDALDILKRNSEKLKSVGLTYARVKDENDKTRVVVGIDSFVGHPGEILHINDLAVFILVAYYIYKTEEDALLDEIMNTFEGYTGIIRNLIEESKWLTVVHGNRIRLTAAGRFVLKELLKRNEAGERRLISIVEDLIGKV